MKIYFAVIILSLIVSSSYKTFGQEIEGSSQLAPVCSDLSYEMVKDCSNSTSNDGVIGCTFSRKIIPCSTDRTATCRFDYTEVNSNQLEITLDGERGYFQFNIAKNKISPKGFKLIRTTHNEFWSKSIIEVLVKLNGSLDRPVEVKAIEYEKNKLTGKIQYSDKVHCLF